MKQIDESIDKSPLSGKSAKEIIEHFKNHNFVDDHGHRLDMCLDFTELVNLVQKPVSKVALSAKQIQELAQFAAEESQPSYTITTGTIPAFEAEDGEMIAEYNGLIAYSDSEERGVLQLA